MAITRAGVKMLFGTKSDRVGDTLGSSVDGAVNGATLLSNNYKFNGTTDSNADVDYGTYKQITGLPSGATLTAVTLDIYNASTNIKVAVYTDSGNAPNTLLGGTTTKAVSISNTNTTEEFTLDTSVTVPSDGKVWVCMYPQATIKIQKTTDSSSVYTNSRYAGSGASYSNAFPSTMWSSTGQGTYNVRFGVKGTDLTTGNSKLGSGCFSFDGSNDYISIDDSSANLIQGRSSAWTIAGWLKRNGSTDKYFISQWGKNSSPDNRVFHIGIDSTGKLLYRQRTDGGQGASFTSNGAITDNTWTHFAIVWQPNGSNWQAQMYINGSADNSKTDFANDMRGGSIDEPVYLGKNGSDATAPSAGGDYFNGELDDLAVWHRALSATEISSLYNSGNGALVSSLSNKSGVKAYYKLDTKSSPVLYTKADHFPNATMSHSGSWYNNSNADKSLDDDESTSAEGSIYTSHTSSGYYNVDLGQTHSGGMIVRWDGFAYYPSSGQAEFKVETSPDNSTWTTRATHNVTAQTSYNRTAWDDEIGGTIRYIRFSCRKLCGSSSCIHHVGFGVDNFKSGSSDTTPNTAVIELDSYTNEPVNTIFVQTDDTPSYWWFNGTEWLS